MLKTIKDALVNTYKKFYKAYISVLNFLFCLLIYFPGVGLSHLLWRFTRKGKSTTKTYWINSQKLPEEKEKYHDQF